jgi:hypothetical protein
MRSKIHEKAARCWGGAVKVIGGNHDSLIPSGVAPVTGPLEIPPDFSVAAVPREPGAPRGVLFRVEDLSQAFPRNS